MTMGNYGRVECLIRTDELQDPHLVERLIEPMVARLKMVLKDNAKDGDTHIRLNLTGYPMTDAELESVAQSAS
jgi:hypothetical protein